MAEVAKLLSHFYIPGVDQAVEKELAKDWADDLAHFSPSAVKDACAEWRRYKRQRPNIADMRELCATHQRILDSKAVATLSPPKSFPAYDPGPLTQEQTNKIKLWWTAWREIGMFPFTGETMDAFKDRIRVRANQIDPNAGWRIPGEPLR